MPIPEKLTAWFTTHQRILPFRENKDPYRIWVSEIMLQQTQVDTVLPYYDRFLKAFPNVRALAEADEDAVFKLWEGLGYYSRARNLLRCARALVDHHDGIFPTDPSSAISLPGIGPYTAGAVLSIAYNLKIPAVDGNVMRVISRLYGLQEDIAAPSTRKNIEKIVLTLIPDNAGDFNQGLMELGALICTPQNPKCGQCPLSDECVAMARNLQGQLPVKKKKSPSPTLQVAAGILHQGGRYLFVRNSEGLLSGLWGFPLTVGDTAEDARGNLLKTVIEGYGCPIEQIEPMGTAKHVFSHKTWKITVYHINVGSALHEGATEYTEPNVETKWLKREEIAELAISTAFRKIMKFLA